MKSLELTKNFLPREVNSPLRPVPAEGEFVVVVGGWVVGVVVGAVPGIHLNVFINGKNSCTRATY